MWRNSLGCISSKLLHSSKSPNFSNNPSPLLLRIPRVNHGSFERSNSTAAGSPSTVVDAFKLGILPSAVNVDPSSLAAFSRAKDVSKHYGQCNWELSEVKLSDTKTSDEDDKERNTVTNSYTLEKIKSALEKLNLRSQKKLQKKLLVLSPNGLLLHRVHSSRNLPNNRSADFISGNFQVFKRPYCDEFLEFCFENFEVGIWSSAQEHNLDRVLDTLMGIFREDLKFVWNQKMSTDSGFNCLEEQGRPMFLKELEKLWEEYGISSSSNTLLIDNEPYKALLNPPNTAIFPEKYNVEDDEDTFLGPNGELQIYLEGLVNADSVTSYVEYHPFGRPEITPSHSDYWLYQNIIHQFI